MKHWLGYDPARWAPATAFAAALLLAACGGGGDGASTAALAPPSLPGPTPTTTPMPTEQPPSSTVAGICTPEAQKQFVRSYLDEVYLWFDEIPAVDPNRFTSVPDYFRALLVRTPDSSGQPRDRFSGVLTVAAADALQSSAQPSSPLLSAATPTRSVPLTKVVESPGGRRVGYVLFNSHDTGAQDALIDAFTQLRDAAVQDLVLDMRFNPGGYLYVARTAAAMVVNAQSDGQVFEQLRYSSKRQSESNAHTFFFSSRVQAPESRFPSGHLLPRLGLSRLYVLTSGLTCSASESIINSLRGIDVEVVLVGETTCGKPYGFRRRDNCGLAFYPIEFQGYNAKNFGDFTTGFAPTCAVKVDLSSTLGASREPLLATALHHVDHAACPAPAGAAAVKSLLGAEMSASPRVDAPLPGRAPWHGKLLGP